MKREQTRYKGVWDAGNAAGLAHANSVLRRFIRAGGQFSENTERWDMNTVTIRVGGRISEVQSQIVVFGMEHLLDKDSAPDR